MVLGIPVFKHIGEVLDGKISFLVTIARFGRFVVLRLYK